MKSLTIKYLVAIVIFAFLIKLAWSIITLLTVEIDDNLDNAPNIIAESPISYSETSEKPVKNAARREIKKESLADEITTQIENDSEEFVIDQKGNKLYAVEIEEIGKQYLSKEMKNNYIKFKTHQKEFMNSIVDAPKNFYNYEFNPEMTQKIELALYEELQFDINGNARYPDILVENLECRGEVCRISFSSINTNDIDTKMAKLSQSLTSLATGGQEYFGRLLTRDFTDSENYTYFISSSIYD